VNSWLLIPAAELHERFSRSSGPGGQSVNTADSRVELSFDVEHSAALPEWARTRAAERLAEDHEPFGFVRPRARVDGGSLGRGRADPGQAAAAAGACCVCD